MYAKYVEYSVPIFARKPRSLDEFKHFKATGFRQFLLYGGVVLLKQFLDEEAYVHFLRLSLAYRIVSSDMFTDSLDAAQMMFEDFVWEYKKHYPQGGMGFNVHGLLHIVDDVKMYGTVDNYSAYKFENYIQILGNIIRSPSMMLQQLYNRMQENEFMGIRTTQPTFNLLKIKKKSACLLKDMKTYVYVTEVTNNIITVQPFLSLKDFFTNPVPSSDLFIVQTGKDEMGSSWGPSFEINKSDIQCICYLLPYLTDYVLLPLL